MIYVLTYWYPYYFDSTKRYAIYLVVFQIEHYCILEGFAE